MTTVFTDGASRNNGYYNCTASWAVFFGNGDSRNCSGLVEKDASNQRAELQAIEMALRLADEQKVTVVTDSLYSIKCLTKWSDAWKRNGWKTRNGGNVKHIDLIQSCLKSMEKSDVKFHHIRSHQKLDCGKTDLENSYIRGNHIVDKMAGNVLPKINAVKVSFGSSRSKKSKKKTKGGEVDIEW